MNAKQAKYPQLRFKGFTDPWEERKAKDLFIPVNERNREDLPVLSVTQDQGVVFRNDLAIDIKYDESTLSSYKVIHPGDFVISLRSFQGGFELSNVLGISSPAYTIFDFAVPAEQDKLYWKAIFKTFKFIESLKTVTFGIRDGKSISFKEFGDLKLNYPSDVDEQRRIGEFFTKLDDTIALHQRKLDLLKEQKKGYLQKMFPKNGAKVPELRFAGFADDWEERKLSDMANVKTGFPFKNENFVDDGQYLVITNGNIQNDSAFVDGKVGNRITAVTDEIKEKYTLNYGDILVTMDGTVGRTAKVVEGNQILAQRVGRLVSESTPEFIYQWLNTGKFFTEMTKVSHGGTIKHISLSEIGDYVAYVPTSKDEREKIGSLFLNIDKTITLHQRKLEKLQELKKGYLQKMFC